MNAVPRSSSSILLAWATSGVKSSCTSHTGTTTTKKGVLVLPPVPRPPAAATVPVSSCSSNSNNNNDAILLDLTNSNSEDDDNDDDDDDKDILQVWTSPASRKRCHSCSPRKSEDNDDTDVDDTAKIATTHNNNTLPSTHQTNDIATEKLAPILDDDDAVAQVRRYQKQHTQRNLRYTLPQFVNELWRSAEDDLGSSTIYLEECKSGLRRANHHVHASESTGQVSAQYGRLQFQGTDHMLTHLLQLHAATDVLVDLGSGIGNVVLQAAYVHQCDARGLEVVELRHVTACAFRDKLAAVHQQLHRARDGLHYQVGHVQLQRGSWHDASYRAFLTDPAPHRTRIKAFCNNYNDVSGEKSVKVAHAKKGWTMDRYTAGLFAGMPAGSILLTLHPLPLPIAPRSAMMQLRQRAGLGTVSNNHDKIKEADASFYELERVSLGPAKDSVSWASHDGELWGYKYTRVAQSCPEAVFLCTNPDCSTARQGTPIPATERRKELPSHHHQNTNKDEEEDGAVVVVRSGCPDCGGGTGGATRAFGLDRSLLRTHGRTVTTNDSS